LPWPLIGSVNEASPCRVLFKRAGITDPGYNASCFVIRACHAVALRERG
jgi:hypothetical protein